MLLPVWIHMAATGVCVMGGFFISVPLLAAAFRAIGLFEAVGQKDACSCSNRACYPSLYRLIT